MVSVSYSSDARLNINDTEFNRYFNTWHGPVGRDLARRGQKVAMLARASAGMKTGQLRASIGVIYNVPKPGVLSLDVVASAPHAAIHHEGAAPHIIVPNRARYLRFEYQGRIVYRTMVRHPGHRPNPFLAKHIREIMR
ncbi:major tail protein [Gordonia phage Phendrix]|uniref:Major tail protein n=2 Tax=Godonkavirus TaxID=2733178 RepID=A0A4D6E218_9CAUD|nr:major tail protein [Gordonia phage GodonK]YP_010649126.1 major tail protein [Gordonia phage Phendrix]QBZ72703.1 major tail protein [Gordonia phage GodonK]QDK02630.1 major tail protein [Gordonia phage Phendrix]